MFTIPIKMLDNIHPTTARLDVHEHFWSVDLLDALRERECTPLVRDDHGLPIVYLDGERPYAVAVNDENAHARSAMLREHGLDAAIVAISSPLGIEALPRLEALELIDAHLTGAGALDERFARWGPIPVNPAEVTDVDHVLDAGCVGVSLPAGAIADVESARRLEPVLRRLERRGRPLFVHPGPGPESRRHRNHSLLEPLWWPAATDYVSQMHAAWLAFQCHLRADLPDLPVVFAMLAGLAPLHGERLQSRGARLEFEHLMNFYDTSSYGPQAVGAVAVAVGHDQLLFGSDAPIVDVAAERLPSTDEWQTLARTASRAFAAPPSAMPVTGAEARL